VKPISIVIPCFNSNVELINNLRELILFKSKKYILVEIILIIDGPNDKLLSEITKKFVSLGIIQIIVLKKNYGQNIATRIGFELAQGEIVITIDDDGQHRLSEIFKLLKNFSAEDVGLIYTKFNRIDQSTTKTVGTKFAKIILTKLSNGVYQEFVNSFRLINKKLIHSKIKDIPIYFAFDLVLLYTKCRVNHIEVIHFERKSGRSNYSIFKLFILFIKLFLQVLFFKSIEWSKRSYLNGKLINSSKNLDSYIFTKI
jgi:undecaprenyl-phosphate 4-deoxy-4-formamido-L-arabinose transferase